MPFRPRLWLDPAQSTRYIDLEGTRLLDLASKGWFTDSLPLENGEESHLRILVGDERYSGIDPYGYSHDDSLKLIVRGMGWMGTFTITSALTRYGHLDEIERALCDGYRRLRRQVEHRAWVHVHWPQITWEAGRG